MLHWAALGCTGDAAAVQECRAGKSPPPCDHPALKLHFLKQKISFSFSFPSFPSLHPFPTQTKGTFRIGLSGPPGAGKSTLIEALGGLLTEAGEKVAVLSVDPSSTLSGGSILGYVVVRSRYFKREKGGASVMTVTVAVASAIISSLRFGFPFFPTYISLLFLLIFLFFVLRVAVVVAVAVAVGSDKTRMHKLSVNPDAYVRPSPSSGSLGGVARNTCDSILLCEAAGYSTVIVETVGVGQSEVAVADMVDMFVLVVPPGGGDELQGIKRGIVELVDMVIVNKADGDLIPASRRAHYEYLSALKLLRQREPSWRPRVVSVSSLEGTGIEKAWSRMTSFKETTEDAGAFQEKRRAQSKVWLWHHVTDRMLKLFKEHPVVASQVNDVEAAVLAGQLTAGQGADTLLDSFSLGGGNR